MKNLLVQGSLIALAFAAAPALAQTAPAPQPDPDEETTLEEEEAAEQAQASAAQTGQAAPAQPEGDVITVTGSRIRRPNLESVVPITSVSAQDLTSRGEVSLGDALNDLPALRATFSQANSTTSIGTAGLSLLDLRGLGTVRTLVLVNGRRHVTAQPGNYNVDVNTIPVDLLERVDVVTGGNSAVYGSDAVAGVVNFILRRDYEGIKVRGQGGVTTYGDRGNQFVSVIAGKNFMDGRLNVTGHAEYANSEEVFFSDRRYLGAYSGPAAFYTTQITTAPNRNFDGIPNTSFWDIEGGDIPGAMFGNISTGGYVFTSCPLPLVPSATFPAGSPQFIAANAANEARRAAVCTGALTPTGTRISSNYAFMPDGIPLRDIPFFDNRPIGGGVFGGLSATGLEDAMLLPGLERYVGNLFVNAELSPAIQPFLEAKFVRVNATQQSTQPTFVAGSATAGLNSVFTINNPFLSPAARAQLATVLGVNTTQLINPATGAACTTPSATCVANPAFGTQNTLFQMFRFNNDLGTRAEQHERDTYRIVAGARGDISETGNLRYEVAVNYGKTKTYYETGGNVHVQRFNQATDAVLDGGNIVCRINSSLDVFPAGHPQAGQVNTTNNDPACAPLNLFGFGNSSQAARDYVLVTSSREQEASQLNATAFLSGDSSGIFEFPAGGPIGFALGAEYRREKARSEYDEVSASGVTFLNAFAPFNPPTAVVKEVFGELRLPMLADVEFARELTLEGAARYSDYKRSGGVWAYNVGLLYSPFQGLRMRTGLARSVRAPNLADTFAARTETFANALTDPCDQPGFGNASNNITANPARAANCAAAGVPTTITYTDDSGVVRTIGWHNVPGSGVSGVNQGNADLVPERSNSFTVGAVIEPPFIPGLALTIDYWDIEVKDVISGLSGQQILNRCYDDPTGIDNEFCDAIFRRTSTNEIENGTFNGQINRRLPGATQFNFGRAGEGISFINQPYNFAALKRRGVDFDLSYRRRIFGDKNLSLRGIVSHLIKSENFSFLTQPDRSDRIHGTFGDPQWAASWNANLDFGTIDLSYGGTFVGKQSILAWETQFTHQGRGPTNPDARPFRWYPSQIVHNARINFQATKNYRFYTGVDNLTNERPPYDLTGIEAGSPFNPTGRFYYAGAEVKF